MQGRASARTASRVYRQCQRPANQLGQHGPMKILFASLPAYGHLYPLMPLALACADAGHDVTVATGAPFVGQLPLPTIQSVPPDADIDGLVAETRRRHPEATGDDLVVGMFADVSAEAISDILLRQLKDGRPDLIIYEAMNTGAGVAASVLGIPLWRLRSASPTAGTRASIQQPSDSDSGSGPSAVSNRHWGHRCSPRRCSIPRRRRFNLSAGPTTCPRSRSAARPGPEELLRCRTGCGRPRPGRGST